MRVFPADYDPDQGVLLCVEKSMVPVLGGLLGQLEDRGEWESESDWEQGYQWAVEKQECLMSCMRELIEEIRALRGLRYDAVPDGLGEYGISDYYSLADLMGMHDAPDVRNVSLRDIYDAVAAQAAADVPTAELGAIIAVSLGFDPALGAAIGTFLPAIGGQLQQIDSAGGLPDMQGIYQQEVPALVKALRGTTEEPDEDALLDKLKDFMVP